MTEPTPQPSSNRSSNKLTIYLIVAIVTIFGFSILLALFLNDDQPEISNNSTQGTRSTPAPVTFIPPTIRPLTPSPYVLLNRQIPYTTLETLGGEEFTLEKYSDKIIVLNFWATWCPPCIREMPALQDFATIAGDDVVVFALTDPNNGQTIDMVSQFLEDTNITTLNIILDQDMGLHAGLGVDQLPMTFFLDKNGIIIERRAGEMTIQILTQIVDDIRNGASS